jgi:hypothetical protein
MHSPSLHHLLVQAHVQELHRSRQARITQPITTNERMAERGRNAAKLPAYLARAIERLVGHTAPEAPAF